MSRNLLRGGVDSDSDFVQRLKSTHQVQDELPANLYTRTKIEERFQNAFTQGLAQGLTEGREAGYKQGYQEGLEQARKEVQSNFDTAHAGQIEDFVSELELLRREAELRYEQWYAGAESQLAVLAVEIARQAVVVEMQTNQDMVFEIARKVLSETTEGAEFSIRVNVADAPVLDARKQEIINQVSHVRGIEVVSDQNISSGCMVEFGSNVVDGRIHTYLQRLAESIHGEAA